MVLEFGASWCGYCRDLAPRLSSALMDHPEVQHLKIEDGPGKPLGRSFRVKLWPTLVFLKDGQVIRQVSRPNQEQIWDGLQAIAEEV